MLRLLAILIAVLIGAPHGCGGEEPIPPPHEPPAEEVGTLLTSWDQYDASDEKLRALLEPDTRSGYHLLIQTEQERVRFANGIDAALAAKTPGGLEGATHSLRQVDMEASSLLAIGAERCSEVSRVLTNPYVDPVWIWGDVWDPPGGQVDCVETAFVVDVWLIDDSLAGESGWQLGHPSEH